MLTLQEYLEDIEKLNKNNLEEMIRIYGKEEVYQYLNTIINSINNNENISLQVKETLLLKFKYFISHYQEEKEVEDIDLLKLYFKEISEYSPLTKEEEKSFIKDLTLAKDISIITKININGNQIPIIDLEKIFVSITNKEEQEYILTTLKKYFLTNQYQESPSTKIVNYYLREYKKLSEKVGIPTITDLNEYFNQGKEYQVFTNFNNKKKLNSNRLREEIDKYVKYQIARTTIINHNLRLVINLAKKYSYNPSLLLDNINNGNIGIIKALEKFEIQKGTVFSTYAYKWIWQVIQRSPTNENLIRYPVHIQERIKSLKNAQQKLSQLFRREPTIQELANNMNLSEKEVEELLLCIMYKSNISSIYSLLEEDTTTYFIDTIPDPEEDVYKKVEQEELKRLLKEKMKQLSKRERTIINARYMSSRILTFEEIANDLGIRKSGVNNAEKKALKKLSKTVPDSYKAFF